MPQSEPSPVEFANDELAQIRQLLNKPTAELEHGNLSQAHEAQLAARHTYEQLAAHIARWSGEHGGDLTLQMAQADQAIARSERRLAAHAQTS